MVATRIDFGALAPADPEREQQVDAARGYLAMLWKNGSSSQTQMFSVEQGRLLAYVELSREEAVDKQYASEWLLNELESVQEAFGAVPSWKILDDEPERFSEANWEGAGALILFTTALDTGSPLRRGDDGDSVAVFRLPVDQQARQDLQHWRAEYSAIDDVWLGCGDLEIPSYKQLVQPTSSLIDAGRTLARTVEGETTLPTYVYLMRYWGRRSEEEGRLCPSCGQEWFVGESDETWLGSFAFRCDLCRLISDLPSTTEDERHARLGE
ncbi:DUF2310 family Zn-ribbon-containing protein [Rubricoccus marinus]|uniref:Nucleic acid-binding protein n=1 Tax=Rubricoccus marinus TaxID=716817 RepID=A0A259U0Z9_9BACT|nr:DUF2310 family Zn-ribbon-containing protein [Rubricoccus marinus]OZC03527.1 hypothetical protein BSZ36_11355 [Rubricoccus marinus]